MLFLFVLYDPRGMIILCFVHKIINDLVLWTHYEKMYTIMPCMGLICMFKYSQSVYL